ncbi:uncharacterized protein PV09_02776 [Verruconis gallopava]|uniref:PX-associated domain-containing protein n=1 Tax=Verruconis gallopava TaxID=253628 RepID=A0A0D1XU76_9PEZI|nr:uncharacterized protein PV09_02776 [Verruconis gallopava]KIW06311.1 hypothetical protein PV09_02776 [Verruconis gallopava]
MAPDSLSPLQAHALFDILTHYEVYNEIQRYKYPEAINNYGPPFAIEPGKSSDSPVLQTLLFRFVLTLPGLKDISEGFWRNRIECLVRKFGEAELSESYDKGTIGLRKTLSAAISVLIEYPTRGVFGGLPRRKLKRVEQDYDLSDANDVKDGWEDFLQELVYGNMAQHLQEKIGVTDRLEDQTLRVQAAHEYILVNLASILHYIMILSPDGPYLVRVLENIHRLVPYGTMRQTLRVGNAATMINGMVKLLLTKMTINSVTSFFGLTNYSDAGMNLLQQIASTVIGWDISELQKQTAKAEKAKDAPSKAHMVAVKNHMKQAREVRDERRRTSERESKSLVQAIFDDEKINAKLSAEQHGKAMDFLSIQLSIRDRQQLSNILCNQNPDIVTQAIRDMVAAYEPIIRECHNAIDLSSTLLDFEHFLTDFIKLSKGSGENTTPPSQPGTPKLIPSRPSTPKPPQRSLPTVEDYVKLLRKYQYAVHKFLHQAVKNDKKLAEKWVKYAQGALLHFRRKDPSSLEESEGGAGDMTDALNKLFCKLPNEQKDLVARTLDSYTAYTMAVSSVSQDKWNALFSSTASSFRSPDAGPGVYLVKWQQLLDSTKITPATAYGPVRTGKDKSVREKVGVGVEAARDKGTAAVNGVLEMMTLPEPPDVQPVIDLLGAGFKEELGSRARKVWERALH